MASNLWYNENIACIFIMCNSKDLTEEVLSKLKLCNKKIKMISAQPIQEFECVTLNMEFDKSEFNTLLLSNAIKTLGFEVKENQRIPELTCGYFICKPDDCTWKMEGLEFGSNIGKSPTLLFYPNATFPSNIFPSPLNLPIKVYRQKNGFPENIGFNNEEYFEILNTKCLGRALLFIPVCETTMNISKSLGYAMPNVDGILVVAETQINGIGRSGNQWLSPKGCAMLTFNYNIPLSSNLGSNLTFIQLIFAPTICINDLLPSDCEKKLSIEEVLAETMNKFEYYINMFENKGKSAFLRHYYNLWLHSNEEVEIQHSSNNEKEMVIIKGLDEYGYLQVQSKNNGKVFSVHDDGNTFDMMKG
uniref:Biotin--protein ligase n=2 Tax=Panagrolaimus sp. PS1159 TaxID=55785 RepID=A0AC35FEQ9_9BILA